MPNNNLKIYNAVRKVPDEAKKQINGGRLKGMTDISPMWRIKTLTEQFGPVGFGWRYTQTKEWIEEGANGEKSAFVNIDLFIKIGEEWSEAIPGTGGSSFVSVEKNGAHTSDECFKMALTDALSVACKALGVGADVYFSADKSKYDDKPANDTPKPLPISSKRKACEDWIISNNKMDSISKRYNVGSVEDLSLQDIENIYSALKSKNIIQ